MSWCSGSLWAFITSQPDCYNNLLTGLLPSFCLSHLQSMGHTEKGASKCTLIWLLPPLIKSLSWLSISYRMKAMFSLAWFIGPLLMQDIGIINLCSVIVLSSHSCTWCSGRADYYSCQHPLSSCIYDTMFTQMLRSLRINISCWWVT